MTVVGIDFSQTPMNKYRIYLDKQMQGPFEIKDLVALPGFSETSQVCEEGDNIWQSARQVRAIWSHLSPAATFSEPVASAPATMTATHKIPTSVKAVRHSGDFALPNTTIHKLRHAAPKPRRKHTTIPAKKFRVIELPQPSLPPAFRRGSLLALLILVGGGLWTVRNTPSIPASFIAGCQTIGSMISVSHFKTFLNQPNVTPPIRSTIHRPVSPQHSQKRKK